jgi:transcription elongation GreA/GreB family factor
MARSSRSNSAERSGVTEVARFVSYTSDVMAPSKAASKAPSPPKLDKADLLAEVRRRVADDLATSIAAQKHTQAGATHEEAKPENDKDTRALEASYLARGQAERVAELERELALLTSLVPHAWKPDAPIALGALVGLDDGERIRWYLLAPGGAGLALERPGATVRVITPRSPIGRALIGKCAGDDCELKTPQGTSEVSVDSVR